MSSISVTSLSPVSIFANISRLKFQPLASKGLKNYYGSSLVDTSGKKSIKILPANGRQKADVVVSARYKYYNEDLTVRENGIIFWTPDGKKIINYPKAHLRNGQNKNSYNNTRELYKGTIRIYKNARDKIYSQKPELEGKFPSYFIECLLYNVTNDNFQRSCPLSFMGSIDWFNTAIYDKAIVDEMVCQNYMYYLFQNSEVTWNINDARIFISEINNLWENWR